MKTVTRRSVIILFIKQGSLGDVNHFLAADDASFPVNQKTGIIFFLFGAAGISHSLCFV